MSEEVNELLDKLGKLEDAPLIWINKKVYDTPKEIERLHNDIKELLKENGNKEKVIKAQDSIIKEVRYYIVTHKLYKFKYDNEELFEIVTDKKAKDELLEILDKEVN